MSTKNSMAAFEEIAEDIQQKLEDGNKQVNVFTAPARMPIVNQFALIFHNNLLLTLDEYKLTLNDLRVILKIIDLMKFGNLVKLSWSDVARSLGINPQNMNRHINKLRKAHLLIDDEGGNTYLNPQIIAKGKFIQGKQDQQLIEVLNLGADAIEGSGRTPSIITERIRRKQKEKAENTLQRSLFDDFGKVED